MLLGEAAGQSINTAALGQRGGPDKVKLPPKATALFGKLQPGSSYRSAEDLDRSVSGLLVYILDTSTKGPKIHCDLWRRCDKDTYGMYDGAQSEARCHLKALRMPAP